MRKLAVFLLCLNIVAIAYALAQAKEPDAAQSVEQRIGLLEKRVADQQKEIELLKHEHENIQKLVGRIIGLLERGTDLQKVLKNLEEIEKKFHKILPGPQVPAPAVPPKRPDQPRVKPKAKGPSANLV